MDTFSTSHPKAAHYREAVRLVTLALAEMQLASYQAGDSAFDLVQDLREALKSDAPSFSKMTPAKKRNA